MVYMYCFGYYVSCKASTIAFPDNAALSDEFLVRLHVGSTIAFPDNAALSDEFLVRLHVALGPTLEMLL